MADLRGLASRATGVTVIVVVLAAAPPAWALPLLVNGDFESGVDGFLSWPGYRGGYVDGGNNPVQLPGWMSLGATGINPIAAAHEAPAPFNDNGNNASHIAFLQNTSVLEQQVSGFSVGTDYVLSLDFNARECCGDVPVGKIYVGGDLLATLADQIPAAYVVPVGGVNPWYHGAFEFTARAESLTIRITSEPLSGGDATLLIDNIAIDPISSPRLGDFNLDDLLTVEDLDLLSRAVRQDPPDLTFDVNGDGSVDGFDRVTWITQVKRTTYGDANLDRVFDSADLITVLAAGEYEDDVPRNSTWAEGDFGGDGEFDSDDLVLALSTGKYEQRSAAAMPVPEPSALTISLAGLLGIAGRCRRFRRARRDR